MKIVVLLKQTFDTEAKISLKNGQIEEQGVTLIINPYDEFALEEALRIKEKQGGQVTLLAIGSDTVKDSLRQGLAMGADRAILIQKNLSIQSDFDDSMVAEALAKVLQEESYDLILTGWKAIDDNGAQMPLRVAEQLGLPQINVVTKLEIADGKATGTREIEGGSEVLEVPLPAMIAAQRGLNEPRYPSMRGIMQARKKELKVIEADQLSLTAEAKVAVNAIFLPEPKKAGTIYQSAPAQAVQELVAALHNEAKVV
ncbi:electron transfer flavoprotein subunit beta/FixA family protein [Heliorestis convoluta]|uniref:Electron transfer flavoprotein subunit beta n=1 Tax=Heliorestis convoluta TaxID=356322 RepID=A0A5Q2MXJ3_9FIRM|nr:electron transfer flavoprotein subunit beta/FixA family protein [Heliorestis convoluta]QGG47444.1 Electron transfer flavoprotein, beta subunit [Heliorestis convoluta]